MPSIQHNNRHNSESRPSRPGPGATIPAAALAAAALLIAGAACGSARAAAGGSPHLTAVLLPADPCASAAAACRTIPAAAPLPVRNANGGVRQIIWGSRSSGAAGWETAGKAASR